MSLSHPPVNLRDRVLRRLGGEFPAARNHMFIFDGRGCISCWPRVA